MSSFGQVPLKAIRAMLEECAPGHTIVERTHYFCIHYRDRTFPTLQKGAHGKSNPLIQAGEIKKMARHLGILDCAKRMLSL